MRDGDCQTFIQDSRSFQAAQTQATRSLAACALACAAFACVWMGFNHSILVRFSQGAGLDLRGPIIGSFAYRTIVIFCEVCPPPAVTAAGLLAQLNTQPEPLSLVRSSLK